MFKIIQNVVRINDNKIIRLFKKIHECIYLIKILLLF